MIALVQRVRGARVEVEGEEIGAIGAGMLVFVCAEPADDEALASRLVDKLLALRIFADADGRMNLGLRETGGALLLVPQFTLAADTARGHRPSFAGAAPPEQGRRLYDAVLRIARGRHPRVESGRFGAHMQVHLVNDGPVTIPLRMR